MFVGRLQLVRGLRKRHCERMNEMRPVLSTSRVKLRPIATRRGGKDRPARPWIALFIALAAGLGIYSWRPAAIRLEHRGATTADGRYVALRFGADDDTKRRAAYLARKSRLPLIAEPGVADVEIRSFVP